MSLRKKVKGKRKSEDIAIKFINLGYNAEVYKTNKRGLYDLIVTKKGK